MLNSKVNVVFTIIILLCSPIHAFKVLETNSSEPDPEYITPSTVAALSAVAQMRSVVNQRYQIDVDELIAATTNTTDTDGDGLPDSVEAILGTDFNNSDSDFDTLNDTFELRNNLDPLEPDSNRDGMPDYFEVTDVPLDIDNDTFPNQWDMDNDGDGVIDSLDLSPFSKSATKRNFTFNIQTDGKPTYMDFQLRPKNPNHMQLPTATWDWPRDNCGSIRDLDNSNGDIDIVPLLELTLSSVPPQSLVHDYGITIDGNKAYIPLIPVQELGLTSAFKGKMFYPGSVQKNLTAEANLIWRINVDADTRREKVTIKAADGTYVLMDNASANKTLITSSSITECSKFLIVELTENRVALKDCNSRFVSVSGNESGNTLIANSTAVGDTEVFNVTDKGNRHLSLKASNGMYVSVKNGILVADSGIEEIFETAKVGDVIDTQTITLVTYREDFMLTGFSVESNHGTDIGLFYSDEINDTFEASVVMSYQYLRNATTKISDMPLEFNRYDVDNIRSIQESFPHRDLALYTMAREHTMQALDDMPQGRILPLIQAFEDNTKHVDMGDLDSDNYTIDLTIQPVITTKTTKMSWYNTSEKEPLNTTDIISQVESWGEGREEDALKTFITIALTWSFGESTITREGQDYTDFESAEAQEVLSNIQLFGLESINIVWAMTNEKAAYYIVKFFTDSNIADLFKQHKTLKSTIKVLEASKSTKSLKTLKLLNKIGKVTEYLGVIIDVVVSVWAWIAIAYSHDGSSFGVALGFVTFLFYLGYALAYLAIASIPFVGWAIALVLAIFDWIGGYGEKWLEAIIDWITETRERSTVDLKFRESSLAVTDYDGNGQDVGDRIDFKAKIDAIVMKGAHGKDYDVNQSYIRPRFVLNLDSYVYGPWTYERYFSDWGSYSNQSGAINLTSDTKITPYDVGMHVVPRTGLVNLPIPVQIVSDYKVYYDDCVSLFFGVPGSYVCSRDYQESTSVSDLTTIFVDVLPGNLTDFVRGWWRYAQDRDGDGLTKDEEVNDWSWDSDGDGISDFYEREMGTDIMHYDTDRDGLNDRMEIYYGTDPFKWDTDGDGLEDYLEIKGWHISFNYSGREFNMTVHSDPLQIDSDGDGIDDQMERWSFLNALSRDTNGDGIMDVARPKYVTYVYFEDKWDMENPQKVDVDNRGFVYVLDCDRYDNISQIRKLDTDGNLITNWTVNPETVDITSDYDGNVYTIITDVDYTWEDAIIQKFDTDGAFLDQFNLSLYIGGGSGIEVDTDGYIYVSNPDEYRLWGPGNPSWGTPVGCVHKYDSDGNEVLRFCNESMSQTLAIDVSADHTYTIGNVDGSGSDPVTKYLKNGTYVMQWGGYGTAPGNFSAPCGIATDPRGFVYVADTENHRIQKFDPEGYFIMRWGGYGNATCPEAEPNCECTVGNCEFKSPTGIAVDKDLYVYVTDSGNDRVTKYSQYTEIDYYNLTLTNVTDTDQDDLVDLFEETGWEITFTTKTETSTINVSSSYLMKDTDLDGLTDNLEYDLLSNPTSVDTDSDGLSDYVEYRLGTNITNYDTDNDGLGDFIEITYGSDPFKGDVDSDGLTDFEEFNYLSDPRNNDTDGDGLSDLEESLFNSSLISADSDGDALLDIAEHGLGSNPNAADSDNDGLIDGYESFFNTSVTGNDTDSDGVLDGTEVNMHLDPVINDTDGDGLLDGAELELGTDPRDPDSDNDGIPDSDDFDSSADNVGNIVLSYDQEYPKFINNLEKYTNVTIAPAADLLSQYSDSPYIVLVGMPDNSTILGGIIHDLLKDTGSVLTEMTQSVYPAMAVRYGVWQPTQTVIILNQPGLSSHFDILNSLKGMNVTKTPNSLSIQYPVQRDSIQIDFIDALKETDSMVIANFMENLTLTLEVTEYNDSTTPLQLPSGISAGKYLEVDVKNSTNDKVEDAYIIIFYRTSDLDKNGDNDINDSTDIDETRLSLYVFNDSWIRLSEDMDWVYELGHNTTNIEMYGEPYEGYIWAHVSHFSLYGLGAAEPVIKILNCSRSQGFWKHQFGKGKHQIDDETLQDLLDIINAVSALFSEEVPAGTIEEAGKVMWEKGKKNSDMRSKAQIQLLAAWLNYAAGAVGWDELIEGMPFNQLIEDAEDILLDPDATHNELVHAKDLAESVNTKPCEWPPTTTTTSTTTITVPTTATTSTTTTTTSTSTTTSTTTSTSTSSTIQASTTSTLSSTTTSSSTTTLIPTTTTTATSTTTIEPTTTTTPPAGVCELTGDYPPCGEVTLGELLDFINLWSAGGAELSNVIDLINAWAGDQTATTTTMTSTTTSTTT